MGMPVAFFEVVSDDHERAQKFYAALFDWQVAADPGMGGYGLVDTGTGEGAIGGGIGPSTGSGDTGVKLYVRVPDLQASPSTVPRSWAGRRWCRRRTCPATSAGSRSSPTRTATRSGCGPDRVRPIPHEQATDEALRALAEPRRRAILRLVARRGAARRADRRGLRRHPHRRQPAPGVLKNAGLLHERRDGTRRLYRARPEGLAGLQAFLDQMWATSLRTAAALVEAERGITDHDDAAAAG